MTKLYFYVNYFRNMSRIMKPRYQKYVNMFLIINMNICTNHIIIIKLREHTSSSMHMDIIVINVVVCIHIDCLNLYYLIYVIAIYVIVIIFFDVKGKNGLKCVVAP